MKVIHVDDDDDDDDDVCVEEGKKLNRERARRFFFHDIYREYWYELMTKARVNLYRNKGSSNLRSIDSDKKFDILRAMLLQKETENYKFVICNNCKIIKYYKFFKFCKIYLINRY